MGRRADGPPLPPLEDEGNESSEPREEKTMETTNQAVATGRFYASFGQRATSWLVDWCVCVAILLAAGRLEPWLNGASRRAGEELSGAFLILKIAVVAIELAGVPAYFVGGWRCGQTLAMKLARIRLADRCTGGRPASLRLTARFAVAVIPVFAVCAALIAALFLAVLNDLSNKPDRTSANEAAVFVALAAAIALVDIAGQLWMLRDPWGQTWADKVGRVVVMRTGAPIRRLPEWIAQ